MSLEIISLGGLGQEYDIVKTVPGKVVGDRGGCDTKTNGQTERDAGGGTYLSVSEPKVVMT